MEIAVEVREGVRILGVMGRLDATTSRTFEESLLSTIEAGGKQVVIDLAKVDYISSSGLRAFIVAAKRLNSLGGKMALCSLKDQVKQAFEIVGFTSILAIHASREDALKSF